MNRRQKIIVSVTGIFIVLLKLYFCRNIDIIVKIVFKK